MKQPIHYCKVKHRTCATETGRRRSPVYGPSYEADMELLDAVSGRTIYRPHRDGTVVIYSEIFSADKECQYADKTVSLQLRRAALWNDLYRENKNNKERIAAYGEIAIPNNISDEEMIALAKRLGQYFAATYKRPCDLSIHKKTGNNHIHFSLPEREYKNGKWMAKRKKYYKDMDGNLIRNKIYKDAKGRDVRRPKINKTLVPKGADPYERNPVTGDYLYQKLGERNKKLWEEDTREGKFLEPEELSVLHNKIDETVNQFLKEQGYDVTVKRNRPEVTKLLKDLGIGQIRIPTRDYKTNSPTVAEIRQKNEWNRLLQQAFESNIDKAERAEINMCIAENEECKAEALESLYTQQRQEEQETYSKANTEYQDAVKDYVENELKPEEAYISDNMQPYQEAISYKEKQCDAANKILIFGIRETEKEIALLEKQENRTERENNKLSFFRKNKTSYQSAIKEVDRIRKLNRTEEMQAFHKNTWRGLSGWKRANYIYKNVGRDEGLMYRDYMLYTGKIKPENKPDTILPKRITFEAALSSVINGKAVPGIKKQTDSTFTAEQNAQIAASASLERWRKNVNSDLHLPPASSDFEFLTLASTVPERIMELNSNPNNLHFYKVQLQNYNPELDLQTYQAEEERLVVIEEKQKVWSLKKLSLLQNAETDKFNKLLVLVKAAAYEYDFKYATQEWEKFKKAEKPYLVSLKKYEDFKESEYAEKERYENKFFSFHEYIPDESEITRLRRIAENKLEALKENYPDYPYNCPKEPSPYHIKYNIDVEFKEVTHDALIKAAEELQIDKRIIMEYEVAATAKRDYLNDKPPAMTIPSEEKTHVLDYQKPSKSNGKAFER